VWFTAALICGAESNTGVDDEDGANVERSRVGGKALIVGFISVATASEPNDEVFLLFLSLSSIQTDILTVRMEVKMVKVET